MDSNLANAISDFHDGMKTTDSPLSPSLPAQYAEPHWYAAYTSANHEKRVAEQLEAREVEHFLPSYMSVRRWKDRRVTLQLPLFPGYVFVRMALRNRLQVVQIPGLAKLVGFGTLPAPLPTEEIDALRSGLAEGLHAEPHPYLAVGQRVRVKQGPLAGLQGVLLRWKGNWRVVLSLELIQRSVAVDVDVCVLEPAMI
ncbi:MAG: transcription termination/antitermination protein NusG [Candidatus Acidiferrales bacterium]